MRSGPALERSGVRAESSGSTGETSERVETIMSVVMEKGSDGTVSDVAGSGWNDGSGPLEFIAGLPVRKGPEIRLGGAMIGGRPVTAVLIEPIGPGVAQAVLVGRDGMNCPVGAFGTVAGLRTMWIRFALNAGIFAGVARMR